MPEFLMSQDIAYRLTMVTGQFVSQVNSNEERMHRYDGTYRYLRLQARGKGPRAVADA